MNAAHHVDRANEAAPPAASDAPTGRENAGGICCEVEIIDRGSELLVRATLPVDARECVSVSIAGNVMTIHARGFQDMVPGHRIAGPSLCQSFCLPLSVCEQDARVSQKGGVVEVIIATGEKPSGGI